MSLCICIKKLSVANFLLDGFAVLAWCLLNLRCHNILANLMWLIHANFMGHVFANLMWLILANLMRHIFAFLMSLSLALLFGVMDCLVMFMWLALFVVASRPVVLLHPAVARLMSVCVLCALRAGTLQLSFFHLSRGRNLVAFRCILVVALLLILVVALLLMLVVALLLVLVVAFFLILVVALPISHLSLNILLWKENR